MRWPILCTTFLLKSWPWIHNQRLLFPCLCKSLYVSTDRRAILCVSDPRGACQSRRGRFAEADVWLPCKVRRVHFRIAALPVCIQPIAYRSLIHAACVCVSVSYVGRFVVETARAVVERGGIGWLMSLRTLPRTDTHAALMQLMGVGAKVADCVCLMSQGA